MNSFTDELNRLATAGEREYARAPQPEDLGTRFVAGVRGIRRRRAGAAVTAVVVAVAGIGLVAAWTGVAQPTPPAAPGSQAWTVQLGADSWSGPAVAHGMVVVGDNDGAVHAFDVSSGGLLWNIEMGGDVRAQVVAVRPGIGFLVVSDNGALSRVDGSGAVVWSQRLGPEVLSRDVYDQTSPAAAVQGDTAIVGWRDGTVSAVSVDTGTLLWRVDVGAPVSATAAVANGWAYVPDREGVLHALSLADGSERWTASVGSEILTSPGVTGSVVVTGSRGTDIVAFGSDTGAEMWRLPLGTSWAESSIEVHEGTIYAGSSNLGQVLAIDGVTGAVKWRAEVGGWPWARPTYADGEVFATTAWNQAQAPALGSTWALDAATGSVSWTASVGGESTWQPDGAASGAMATPGVGEGVVAVVALDGTLVLFAR